MVGPEDVDAMFLGVGTIEVRENWSQNVGNRVSAYARRERGQETGLCSRGPNVRSRLASINGTCEAALIPISPCGSILKTLWLLTYLDALCDAT